MDHDANRGPQRRELPPGRGPDSDELYPLRNEPEAQRLVEIFRDLYALGRRALDYQSDHPRKCECAVCQWVDEHEYGGANVHDYMSAIACLAEGSSANHEQLPLPI